MFTRLQGLFVALVFLASSAQAKAPPPLEAYGDLPDLECMAMSPSGKGIAFVARVNGERRLLAVDADHKARIDAPVGDTKLRCMRWAGEDLLLVTTSATVPASEQFTASKYELSGVMVIPFDGSKPHTIFEKQRSMIRAVQGDFGTRFVDGRWSGYYAGIDYSVRRQGGLYITLTPGLYEVDLATNRTDELARPADQGHARDWLVDANGQVGATLDIRTSDGKWEISNAQGTALVSAIDPSGHVRLLSFDQTGTGVVYVLEDVTSQITRWYDVPLAGGAPSEILPEVNVERAYIDPDNGRLLGYLDRDSGKPVLFDPDRQSVLSKVYRAFPNLDVKIEQWTADFKHMLVHVSGNGDSGTWYAVDMTLMRADPVGYDRMGIEPAQVGPISTVAYKSADGLDLDGVLTLPPGSDHKNLPVILLPHDGPHCADKAAFDWWAQAFASRGYAVFQPNFRGSTNRDASFVHAGDGQWGRKMQTDISDALAELARLGIVDADRACIMGIGYGGYAALAGVTLQHGLYRCAVAVAAISALKDMYWAKYREGGENAMVKRNYQENLGDPKTFDEVSPRKHAARADAPILLIHGKDDTVVPFNQSTRMADALKDAGKPFEFVTLREEDHWLSKAETRKQMLAEAMRFIQKYNPAD